MTLFFNLEKILRLSKNTPSKTVEILQEMVYDNPYSNVKARLNGSSYLINPEKLLKDKTTDILYIHQYILLAARRDYSHYKLFGVKSLPLSYYPDINLSSIRTNPLLNVTNQQINFKYEE